MQAEFINNNSRDIIIFLTGWGCDARQFRFMKSEQNDILILYDYTDLEWDFDFSKYKNISLIAFSAGVYVGGLIYEKLPKLTKSIAINGNPLAYDDYFGLRKEIKDVFQGVSSETALSFRRKYMVISDDEYNLFNRYHPCRTYESCKTELKSLAEYYNNSKAMNYDVAILSKKDKIFDTNRQNEYWKNRSRCVYLEDSAHFPFFTLNDFDEIIKL
ncbi:MAG: DUF452 family protein [Candidatus Gastranaerophilales bacterium]|nr:DUF452 family protein [Candidatus Gastranaerophilales bacterium]